MFLPSPTSTFGFFLGGPELLLLIVLGIPCFFVIRFAFRRLRRITPDKPSDEQGNGFVSKSPHGGRQLRPITIKSISEERIKGSPQQQHVDPGAKLTIEKSKNIEHAVSIETCGVVQAGLGFGIYGCIQSEIRLQIERRLGESFKETETTIVAVELDGTKAQQWELVWYDKVVTGVAEYTDDQGRIHLMNFRFPVASELEAISIKDFKEQHNSASAH